MWGHIWGHVKTKWGHTVTPEFFNARRTSSFDSVQLWSTVIWKYLDGGVYHQYWLYRRLTTQVITPATPTNHASNYPLRKMLREVPWIMAYPTRPPPHGGKLGVCAGLKPSAMCIRSKVDIENLGGYAVTGSRADTGQARPAIERTAFIRAKASMI